VKARLSSFHASGFSNSTQLRPDISPTLSNLRSVNQSSHHHIYHTIALGLLESAHRDAAQRSRLSPPKERYEKRLFRQPRMERPHGAGPVRDTRDQFPSPLIKDFSNPSDYHDHQYYLLIHESSSYSEFLFVRISGYFLGLDTTTPHTPTHNKQHVSQS
jgi:hypothetical protein